MRLYINEVIKAFFRRRTIGIFLILTVLNGILLCVNENKNQQLYTPKQYKAVYESIENMRADETVLMLLKKQQELNVYELLLFGENVSGIYDDSDTQSVIETYNSQNYLEYTDNIFAEQYLISDVLKEVKSCTDYDIYLSKIDEQANMMTSISIFADKDSFSYKNIAKTPGDFAHLKGSVLTPAPSRGVDMATGFLLTDIIAFLMIMTVIVTIVTREKELDQIILSRSTKKGRTSLAIAKLFICFTSAFITLVLLYSVNFTVGYFTYGYGEISRQIQSVYSFNGSNLKISVIEYFVLFLLSKFGVYCLMAAMMYLITAASNSAVKVYIILTIILASQVTMYYTISGTSWLCPLKYINLVAFLYTHDIFAKYLNLNIFGVPFGYMSIFVISVCFLILTFSVFSIIAFANQSVIRNRTRLLTLNVFKGRNTNLFLHECYKIFIGGKVLFILLAFGIFVWFSYIPINEKFSSADEIYYKQYMIKLEGELTSAKELFLADEDARFQQIEKDMLLEMSQENGAFAAMKYQNLLAPKSAFEKVKQHAEYLKSTEYGEFIYDSGYKLLTGDDSAGNKDATLALTSLIMLICTLTYINSVEHQTGAYVLLHTSSRRRSSVFFSKLLIGVIIMTIIYIITYAPYFYNVLNAYGTRGITAPACSMEHLSGVKMSIWGYLTMISVIRYLGLVVSMFIIFFVSLKAKSFIVSLLIETSVLIIPIVLYMLV